MLVLVVFWFCVLLLFGVLCFCLWCVAVLGGGLVRFGLVVLATLVIVLNSVALGVLCILHVWYGLFQVVMVPLLVGFVLVFLLFCLHVVVCLRCCYG